MKDGSTLSGMVRGETPEFAKLALPGGAAIDVKLADVAKREEIPQSLMPAGLFDALPLDQVADLVKYLASPGQVPLPGDKPASESTSAVPPPAEGVVRFEGEAFATTAIVKSGTVREQGMKGFGPGWSGNRQLWWTGGVPGEILTLKVPGLKPGTYHVSLFPTTAPDYAMIRVSINGQLVEADLYTRGVLPAPEMRFEKVNVSPGEPLQIDVHLTGANPQAKPSHMFGLDRIEAVPLK
jgi:hypothetical protein